MTEWLLRSVRVLARLDMTMGVTIAVLLLAWMAWH
jgi:hypothetical protein